MNRTRYLAAAFGLLCLLSQSGCILEPTDFGPNLGILSYPIPISPYLQDQEEDEWWWQERYAKAPILEPLAPGVPAIALDPPSQDEIMRTLENARPVEGGVPFLFETQRNNVRIVVEQLTDFVDPPRVMPLVGPVQLHHARYKCTVYFKEITRVGWPVPYTRTNEDAREVLYIDHSHLHMVGNVDTGVMGAQ